MPLMNDPGSRAKRILGSRPAWAVYLVLTRIQTHQIPLSHRNNVWTKFLVFVKKKNVCIRIQLSKGHLLHLLFFSWNWFTKTADRLPSFPRYCSYNPWVFNITLFVFLYICFRSTGMRVFCFIRGELTSPVELLVFHHSLLRVIRHLIMP